MKIRNGFVSNSSSSSFVIQTDRFTDMELMAMKNVFEMWDRVIIIENGNNIEIYANEDRGVNTLINDIFVACCNANQIGGNV